MNKQANTGYWNAGNCNTGDWNTGCCNTGYWNAGNCNTGDWNTGCCNTGNRNTGDWNTGYWNAGNCNTGDWNTGCCNTGYCNTVTPEDCLIFNKPAKRKDWVNADKPSWMHASLTEWVCEEDMTDKEKEAYPSYTTTGGYLKCYSSLQHAWAEAWGKASEADKAKTFKLPNFDAEVFKEIFGFNPCKNHTIVIDGKEIELSADSYKKLKESLV